MTDKKRGRQVGWRKEEGTRKQRQLRAYDDEWEMIQAFARLIKYGDKAAAQKFLAQYTSN